VVQAWPIKAAAIRVQRLALGVMRHAATDAAGPKRGTCAPQLERALRNRRKRIARCAVSSPRVHGQRVSAVERGVLGAAEVAEEGAIVCGAEEGLVAREPDLDLRAARNELHERLRRPLHLHDLLHAQNIRHVTPSEWLSHIRRAAAADVRHEMDTQQHEVAACEQ
jgi:hypothetical protein